MQDNYDQKNIITQPGRYSRYKCRNRETKSQIVTPDTNFFTKL